MRRIGATFLLGIFSLLLMLPVVSSTPNLPACCRREGKHHCQMQASSAGPAMQSARCASYPGAKAGPLTMAVLASPMAAHSGTLATGAPAAQAQPLHLSFSRAGQKRGPPSLSC